MEPKGDKKHINFLNLSFLHPTQNPHFWGPRKKLIHFLGKDAKSDPRKHFRGDSFQERGSGCVQSAGVSQSVRETSRDESRSVPSPEKLFKTRDLKLPIIEGSLPSCWPHSAGYTRTFLHPYFPVANFWGNKGPQTGHFGLQKVFFVIF